MVFLVLFWTSAAGPANPKASNIGRHLSGAYAPGLIGAHAISGGVKNPAAPHFEFTFSSTTWPSLRNASKERPQKMAEPIGIASGVVALTAFAFKSSIALYQTINSFRHHSDTVRDLRNELEALQGALHSLTETADGTVGTDFSALSLPLLRCGNACRDFEQKILSSASRSDAVLANFRGWAKLRYLGDDVDNFRRMLSGYKSTILIAITDATLCVQTPSLPPPHPFHL